MVPSPFGQNFYQIVQTAAHVMIFTEMVHDARVIRIGGTHAPPAVQLWLGDSIGH
jgi:quinol-cytochrome oxidoreductase complex cytochrome b subunit